MLAATIRRVGQQGDDFEAYCGLRIMLWPMPNEDNRREASQVLAESQKWSVFLATGERGKPLGFVEVRLREYAENAFFIAGRLSRGLVRRTESAEAKRRTKAR